MKCYNWFRYRVASCRRRLCTECVCRPPDSQLSSSSSRSSPSSPSSSPALSATTGSFRRWPRREPQPRKAQPASIYNGIGASPPSSECLRHRRLSLARDCCPAGDNVDVKRAGTDVREQALPVLGSQISRPMWANHPTNQRSNERQLCAPGPSLRTHKCSTHQNYPPPSE